MSENIEGYTIDAARNLANAGVLYFTYQNQPDEHQVTRIIKHNESESCVDFTLGGEDYGLSGWNVYCAETAYRYQVEKCNFYIEEEDVLDAQIVD